MKEKPISKKENLFAASRFVLPEHREWYLEMKREEQRFVPPELDDDQRAEIAKRLWQSFRERRPITCRYYDGESVKSITGWIAHMDPALQSLKLRTKQQTAWIQMAWLLEAEWE